MDTNDELLKELEELSPFLAKRKEEPDGFNVPRHYFHNLPDEILRQVQPVTGPEPVYSTGSSLLQNVVQRFWRPQYALAFAGVSMVVIAMVWVLKPSDILDTTVSPPTVSIEELPDEAIHSYLSENPDDLDNELILESHLADSENQSLEQVTPKPKTEELEDYLDDVIDEIEVEDLEELL